MILGAGARLAPSLARVIGRIVSVDPTEPALEEIGGEAGGTQLAAVVPIAVDLTEFVLARESVDLVVSSYVLHHLHNAEKKAIVNGARRWLRPGGRLVVGDMMFQRGSSPGDQGIVRTKLRILEDERPGRTWQHLRTITKFGYHLATSSAAPPEFWITAFRDAGFHNVGHTQVSSEAGVVWGQI
ncbi:hypothetical protein GCM10010191_49170 [Actinomadura vinacea]|uniref:Methyltransferase type 11 domain-containing protein n=1 Tax=Actinomadura vinacea TaxID=115336 RepID=A0ABP5WPF9_9ACTN